MDDATKRDLNETWIKYFRDGLNKLSFYEVRTLEEHLDDIKTMVADIDHYDQLVNRLKWWHRKQKKRADSLREKLLENAHYYTDKEPTITIDSSTENFIGFIVVDNKAVAYATLEKGRMIDFVSTQPVKEKY